MAASPEFIEAGRRNIAMNQSRFYFGSGPDLRTCSAMTKHTGVPCRQPAVLGSDFCKHHGGQRVLAHRKDRPPPSEKTKRSRALVKVRRLAKQFIANNAVTPGAQEIVRQYAYRLNWEADVPRLTEAAVRYDRGELPHKAFWDVLENLGAKKPGL